MDDDTPSMDQQRSIDGDKPKPAKPRRHGGPVWATKHSKKGTMARPGTSKRGPRWIKIRKRQQQALQLRLKGWAYERIGKELGCGKSQAERDITNVMVEMVAEPSAQIFKTEMARLDAVLAGHFDAACAGDNAAAYVCLRIAELRGRFLGWDRPDVAARLLVSSGDGTNKQLAIEFVLPSGIRMNSDDPPSPASWSASRLSSPSSASSQIMPREDDVVLDRVQPSGSAWKKHRGSWMD